MRFAALIAVAMLAGCSNYMGNVIPRDGGLYEITDKGRNEDESMELALWSARKTCERQGKRHVVKTARTEYKGAYVDERTNKVFPLFSSTEDYRTTLLFSCDA